MQPKSPLVSSLNLNDASINNDKQGQDEPTQNHCTLERLTALRGAPSIILPHTKSTHQHAAQFALDIGGSLIKLIFLSADQTGSGHRLHFVKFETRLLDQCMDFIASRGLHRAPAGQPLRVKATGGGAHKFAPQFFTRLGLILDPVDEMQALVEGCCFLTRAISDEVFVYEQGRSEFVPIQSDDDIFPFLLVNIGSGVSMLKVHADGSHERVSGSSLGGGTFWGLARLLTGAQSFDEVLALCAQGDNGTVDMLVGDIYSGDYESIGLPASTIASSFGKVVSGGLSLADVKPADAALSALRMISYNIGQLAFLNAKRYGLQRVVFGGFFLRGHPFTMETISFSIRFWSQGEMAAMFLRHEGFLGALGAFRRSQELHAVEPLPHTPTPPAAAVTGPTPPAMDTVAALQTGWSTAADVDDYAGAIGGVLERELRLQVSKEWSASFTHRLDLQPDPDPQH